MKSILFALVMIVPLAAAAKETKTVDYIALNRDTSNPYWKTLEQGFKETAKEMGVSINTYATRNETDAEGQLNQCESALLKKPKAIIFAAIDAGNLGPCLKKADASGILLVDIDGNIDEARAKQMGISVAFSVASNNTDLGKKAAEYLKGEKGKVLVIEGASAHLNSQARVKGFKGNLPSGLTIVASQSAEWDRQKAADIVARTLIKHPDLSFVYAVNDGMALGAVEALRAAGNKNVRVIGIDGTSDALKSIREGRLTATIAQLPYLMAKEALKKSAAIIKDKKPLPYKQYVPVFAIDRTVLEENKNPLLEYIR